MRPPDAPLAAVPGKPVPMMLIPPNKPVLASARNAKVEAAIWDISPGKSPLKMGSVELATQRQLQRVLERDIIQMLPVSSASTQAIRPPAADQPPCW